MSHGRRAGKHGKAPTKNMAKKHGLGSSLKKDHRNQRKRRVNEKYEHMHVIDNSTNMESILDHDDLSALMDYAELSGKHFLAEKERSLIITNDSFTVDKVDPRQIEQQEQHWNELTIPRRPFWTKQMSKDELDQAERSAFLQWRQSLVELEENEHLLLTPFEKNIEVWRQLWRVVERSDLVIQIVDGRNPLLFRSIDLERYVSDVASYKKNLLVINKSDFLTPQQRLYWVEYFRAEGINYVFFSAFEEIEKNEQLNADAAVPAEPESPLAAEEAAASAAAAQPAKVPRVSQANHFALLAREGEGDAETETEDVGAELSEALSQVAQGDQGAAEEQDEDEEDEKEQADAVSAEHAPAESPELPTSEDAVGGGDVEATTPAAEEGGELSAEQLESIRLHSSEDLLQRIHNEVEEIMVAKKIYVAEREQNGERVLPIDRETDLWAVGLVGYPNVGKSSTINALSSSKSVAVSKTPGKTKHFQTIQLPGTPLTLVDCPGLVFPSFMSTRSEMVCAGLIRVAELREPIGPTRLLCERIPRQLLEEKYSIVLPQPASHEDRHRPPTPAELLDSVGYMRGFMTRHGIPDRSRTARILLTDYLTGSLLYCHAPPRVPETDFNPVAEVAGHQVRAAPSTVSEALQQQREEEEHQMNRLVLDEEFGGVKATKGSLSIEVNAYTKARTGRKEMRRIKKKQRMENMSGAYTTGKGARNFKGTYQINGQSGLPTQVRFRTPDAKQKQQQQQQSATPTDAT